MKKIFKGTLSLKTLFIDEAFGHLEYKNAIKKIIGPY